VHYIDFKICQTLETTKLEQKKHNKKPPVVWLFEFSKSHWFQCDSPCPGDDIPQNGSLIFLGTMVIMNIENRPDIITRWDLLLFFENCPTRVYIL
jgi:hypothetical protein